MKVVLTHAYFLKHDPKEQLIMKPYPPLGILYISAWLEKHGIENEVYDSTFGDPISQLNYLITTNPEIIAIYTNLITKLEIASLIKSIKSNSTLANSLVVLGGPDITFNIDEYLDLGADLVVIGEGEQSMLEVAQAIQKNARGFDQIAGIAFKNTEGKVIKTTARQKINDIDDLPFPNRNKIDLSLYLNVWKKHHGKSTISINTQRGCPYTCKWCSTAVYGQSYRRRSPKVVVDEIEDLNIIYQPDQIWFVDDVFSISHKWLIEFANELHNRKVKISFECITRADRLNEDVIKTLKEAGCFRVWIGAESGSQKILDAMDRRVDASQVQNMIINAKKQGLETGTFIMLGYPGETEKDIILTLDHLKKASPDLFTITVAYPIKGTALYKMTSNVQIKKEWNKSTDREIDFKRTYPRKYYDYAVKWIVNHMHLYNFQKKQKNNFIVYLQLRIKVIVSRLCMHLLKLS